MKRFKFYTTVGIIETDEYSDRFKYDRFKYVWHREDGPAFIRYNVDGSIHSEAWYINGVLHREDSPAIIEYYNDGSIFCELWYWCGMEHRHDYTLPTSRCHDGKQYYYWYGVHCSPKDLLDKDFRDRIALRVLG